jgi:hypothetical protein
MSRRAGFEWFRTCDEETTLSLSVLIYQEETDVASSPDLSDKRFRSASVSVMAVVFSSKIRLHHAGWTLQQEKKDADTKARARVLNIYSFWSTSHPRGIPTFRKLRARSESISSAPLYKSCEAGFGPLRKNRRNSSGSWSDGEELERIRTDPKWSNSCERNWCGHTGDTDPIATAYNGNIRMFSPNLHFWYRNMAVLWPWWSKLPKHMKSRLGRTRSL